MNRPSNRKIPMFPALSAAALILSCHFPYAPEQFTLPEQPYKFPSRTEMQTFFNTQNVKLAYVLKDNGHQTVYYFDNNDTSRTQDKKMKKPARNEDFDTDSPLISPDGSFVAYDLRQGGILIHGAYIQKLDTNAAPVLIDANGTEPHWWVDPSDSQVYVIYSDQILINKGDLTPGSGHTYKMAVSLSGNGSVMGAAIELAPYPMNGGLSKDGGYLCSGYFVAAFCEITVVSKPLTMINENVQVCNPSICPDTAHPDWMMFLNFSGKQLLVNPFFPSDSFLGAHTFIFIVDIGNTVRDYVPISIMGNGYHAWQCPEWSNNPDFAAAIALADDDAATGEGVIIKGIGNYATNKETLIFTRGNGKLNFESTPYVWVGN